MFTVSMRCKSHAFTNPTLGRHCGEIGSAHTICIWPLKTHQEVILVKVDAVKLQRLAIPLGLL